MRLLVVEDEASLQAVIAKRLTQEGYSVDVCGDGQEALDFLDAAEYDCVVLDVMLPRKSGLDVLRILRARDDGTPVLLLTAMDSIADRVNGLDAGADDYLVKPFSFDELLARIRALFRRKGEAKTAQLSIDDLTMDTAARVVRRSGRLIELTAKEYALLEYFLRNKNHVLSRDQIIEHIWNFDFDGDSNIVDVYVRYLRRKIDYDFPHKLIHTVRGTGYVLREEDETNHH